LDIIKRHIAQIISFLVLGLILGPQSLIAQDITAPDTPVIDSVTVQWLNPSNPNGDILITWQKCDSVDVRSYYIKYLNEVLGTYKLLDSVHANTTTYLDTKVITDPHYPQTYVVQAVDSANNTSNHSAPHKTVRIFPWQKDENCEIKVELTWNAYLGWDEGIDYYDIYVVYNSTHHYLGRFQEDELTLIYPLNNNTNYYEFYAKVTSNNGRTSTSNKIPFTPDIPLEPTFINAEYVTVEGKQIRILFNLDSLADINNYHLMRSIDSTGNFVDIMQFNNYKKNILEITDADVKVDAHQYFYKLNLFDECQTFLKSSGVLSSILLTGEANSDFYYQMLYWSDYYSENLLQKEYSLYRSSDSEIRKEIYYSSSDFVYKDDLRNQNFESFVGDFCYQIQVDPENIGGQVVLSNTVCLAQPPSVIMPTAFAPAGMVENRIFKPSFAFISSDNYYFVVYDRWGMKIFETQDYKEGWSGKDKSEFYPTGIYSYYLEYYSSDGKVFDKTGTFTLIN
jgi:hypothetical protein